MSNTIDGLHLLVDCLVKDPGLVFKQKNLKNLMLRLVKDLNMELIWGPKFKHVKLDPSKLTGDVFQDEGGTSGVCMIGTSHVSIHVWPLRRFVHMDVFSCKTFNKDIALKTIHEFLQPESISVKAVRRSQNGLQPVREQPKQRTASRENGKSVSAQN